MKKRENERKFDAFTVILGTLQRRSRIELFLKTTETNYKSSVCSNRSRFLRKVVFSSAILTKLLLCTVASSSLHSTILCILHVLVYLKDE